MPQLFCQENAARAWWETVESQESLKSAKPTFGRPLLRDMPLISGAEFHAKCAGLATGKRMHAKIVAGMELLGGRPATAVFDRLASRGLRVQ